MKVFTFILLLFPQLILALTPFPAPQGLPKVWNGDRHYKSSTVTSNSWPAWVNGYFFNQVCGSYGDQSAPLGQKLIHMFDAVGAVAEFELNADGNHRYSARYYPTREYGIWNFYGRDLSQSKVAWYTGFTPWDQTKINSWGGVPDPAGQLGSAPNVDFWKVGQSIIGGTEYYKIGYTFDVPTLSQFRLYPFKETAPIFSDPNYPVKCWNNPIHERLQNDEGSLYSSTSAIDPPKADGTGQLRQIIYKVDKTGKRTVEGTYLFQRFNLFTDCDTSTMTFNGSMDAVTSNIHSITSTKNYIIVPINSVMLNPCIWYPKNSSAGSESGSPDVIVDPNSQPQNYVYNPKFPLRFLVFHKFKKRFMTTKPLQFSQPRFISHQWNAYENANGTIFADMIGYDNFVYRSLFADNLTSMNFPQAFAHRFELNLQTQTVTSRNIFNTSQSLIEFTQFNHNFEGLPYRYGYVLQYPYLANSAILKVDMNDPSGNGNKVWRPRNPTALAEPWFIPRQPPSATPPKPQDEEDGVVIVKGLDVTINRTGVFILDPKSMTLLAETWAPDAVPFGFHNRFYTKAQLGLPPGPQPATTVTPPTPAPSTPTVTPTAPPTSPPTTSGIAGTRYEQLLGTNAIFLLILTFCLHVFCKE